MWQKTKRLLKNRDFIICAVLSLFLIASMLVQSFGIKTDRGTVTFTIGNPAYATSTPDYVCDGTADDIQFQQAMNALPATGGRLVVLGGNYQFTATVSRGINNITVQGVGLGTYIVYNGADPIFSCNALTGWAFQDIRTDAGSITTNADTIFSNVQCGVTKYVLAVNKVEYGAGVGDMTKAVYDPTDSGSVVSADSATSATSATTATNVSGGTADVTSLTDSGLTSGRVPIAGVGGLIGDDADLTFSGSTLTATNIADSSLTSGRIPIAGAGGLLGDDADLTFSSDTLTATKFAGNGAALTNLEAGDISTGTIGTARLGSGTADGTTFLRGDQTWQAIGAGAGDMTKAEYDTDDDGTVNSADSATTATNLSGGTVDATEIKDDDLTSGRVVIAGANGILGDDTDLTFSGDTLSATKLESSSLTTGRDVVTSTGGLLIDKVISGTTFPVSPKAGDQFLHAPTGRKILYQYNGTNWIAIRLMGACTVYVDTTGTDDLVHGTATGTDAFATIQYAINLFPKTMGYSPSIYIGAGTFTENPTVQVRFDGSISLYGTLTSTADLTATGGYAGSGANAAYVSGTFVAAAHNNKLIQFKADTTTVALRGVKRVISKTTTTRLWLVGGLPGTPQNGDTYDVMDWGTTISGIVANNYALINLTDLKVLNTASSVALYTYPYGRTGASYCYITNSYASAWGTIAPDTLSVNSFWYSVIESTAASSSVILTRWGSNLELQACKLIGPAKGTSNILLVSDNSAVNFNSCEVKDGLVGVYAEYGGQVLWWIDSGTNNFVHGCTTGIKSDLGGANQGYATVTTYTDIDGTADANTTNASDTQSVGSLTATSVTDSGLTSGQIPVAGTGGLLGNGPKWSTAMDTSIAKAVHKTITAGVVKAGKYFVIPLDSDSGAAVTDGFDPGSNFTIGTLYNGIRADASGCNATTLIDSDVSPTFTTNLYKLCGGADQYCFIKWSSDSGYTADTGYGWATYVDANTLTLFKSTGADFANNNYYWIYASYYTVPVTGYYQIDGQISFSDCEDGKRYVAALMVNGVGYSIASQQAAASSSVLSNAYSVIYHFTAGDIVLLLGTTVGATDSVCYVDKGRLSSLTIRCIKLD